MTKNDALEMMHDLRFSNILDGYRGLPTVDRNKLADLLVKTSTLMLKEKLVELDFNPVIVQSAVCTVVDARLVRP